MRVPMRVPMGVTMVREGQGRLPIPWCSRAYSYVLGPRIGRRCGSHRCGQPLQPCRSRAACPLCAGPWTGMGRAGMGVIHFAIKIDADLSGRSDVHTTRVAAPPPRRIARAAGRQCRPRVDNLVEHVTSPASRPACGVLPVRADHCRPANNVKSNTSSTC